MIDVFAGRGLAALVYFGGSRLLDRRDARRRLRGRPRQDLESPAERPGVTAACP